MPAPRILIPGGKAESTRLFEEVVRAIALVLDLDGDDKHQHAARVGLLAGDLARAWDRQVDPGAVTLAGLLHDVGGLGLPDHVVHHAALGFLDPGARRHAEDGAALLRPLPLFAPIARTVAEHHERLDGRGFPRGLKDQAIAPESLVVGLADTIEAELREAPAATRLASARRALQKLAGRAWPADLCEAGLALLDRSPGTFLDLYDDEVLADRLGRAAFAPAALHAERPERAFGQLVWLLARTSDGKHDWHQGHAWRVTLLSRRIEAAACGAATSDWDLIVAGLLHDVGMAIIPRGLTSRPGPLSSEQHDQVHRHAEATSRVLASVRAFAPLAADAAAHHEHWDGRGYPARIRGDAIPFAARILAYADAYDALRSARPWRLGLAHGEAMARLRAAVGTQFDPHLADAALGVLDRTGASEWPPPNGLLGLGNEAGAFPDLRERLPSTEAPVRLRPAARTTGAAVLPLEPFRRLKVDLAGFVLEGREELSALLESPAPEALLEAVDEGSRARLCSWLAGTRETFTGWLYTPDGRPLECAGVRHCGGASLLLRSAANPLQSVDGMALLYRNFLSSAEAAFFAGPDGRVIDVNRRFLDTYGLQLREVIGARPGLLERGGGDGRSFELLMEKARASATGSWCGEVATWARSGAEVPVLLTLVAVQDREGALAGYIARAVDLSERRRLEQELALKNQELEALSQLKSDLVAVTSHDLRSPLAGISGYTDLLRDALDRGNTAHARAHLESIQAVAQSMLRFVTDVLDLDRVDSGRLTLQPAPLLLDELARTALEQHRPAALSRRIALELAVPPEPVFVLADPTRLAQVLHNLVGNALKFSPDGSRIDVRLSAQPGPDGQVTVEVLDRGPGIPEAELEQVFDRYHQVLRRKGVSPRNFGAGLGLTIARSVMELHGGKLHAENREGGGCRFVATLGRRTAVTGSRRTLALLVDPEGAFADAVGPELSARDAWTLTLHRADAAPVLLRDARADLVLLQEDSLGAALLTCATALAAEEAHAPLVLDVRAHPAADASPQVASRSVSLPLLDVEVGELLREVRVARAQAGKGAV